MLTTLKTAALSAMIGLGAIAALPQAAQAEGLYLNYGHRDGASIGFEFGDSDRVDYRDYRDYRRHDRRPMRACTPNRALDKADRIGLHRARVIDVDRRTIKVAGRKYGDRIVVTFGRAPNCPIVRW